jgi:hypothetical protein
VQSRQWIFARALLGALALIASVGCAQRADSRGDRPPITGDDAYRRQVELDVAAIVAGMTQAHGAQAVALMPKWLQDFLSHP